MFLISLVKWSLTNLPLEYFVFGRVACADHLEGYDEERGCKLLVGSSLVDRLKRRCHPKYSSDLPTWWIGVRLRILPNKT